MKLFRYFVLLLLFVFSLVLTPPAHALEFKGGEVSRVPVGQVIHGSLIISGENVTIDGEVEGDVFCAGQRVVVSGTVDGDVICAGQTIDIRGKVAGDVRLAGQNITITSSIARNATVFGQSLVVSQDATIAGDLLFGGQTLTIDGIVGKSIAGGGQLVTIAGKVKGDVGVMVETLDIVGDATITGSLNYTSEKKVTISDTATVSGNIKQTIPPEKVKPKELRPFAIRDMARPWPASALPGILFYLVIGLITVALFPKFTDRVTVKMQETPFITGLVGAAGVFIGPLAALMLILTILGIPIAIVLILLYAFVLCISRLFVGLLAGRFILDSFGVKSKDNRFIQMLVGVPVLWFIFKVPFIGGLLAFLAVLWATGGILRSLAKSKK